jgi:hypothetical protein
MREERHRRGRTLARFDEQKMTGAKVAQPDARRVHIWFIRTCHLLHMPPTPSLLERIVGVFRALAHFLFGD